MKNKIRQVFFSIAILLIYGVMMGCANPFEEMEKYFEEGRYLAAAQKAIEGMKDKELRPKIESFLKDRGEKMLEKAIYKGESLLRYKGRDAIHYFSSLLKVIEEMVLMDYSVRRLESFEAQSKKLLNEAIQTYVQREYKEGTAEFKKENYRASMRHFENVDDYKPDYEETSAYLVRAQKFAQRRISINPFFKPADMVTQFLGDTFTNLISRGQHALGTIAVPLKIADQDVAELFNSALLYQLNSGKSEFLMFSMDEVSNNLDYFHYYVEGILDATESVETQKILKDTDKDGKEEVYTEVIYSIRITVEGAVFLTKNDSEIARISFSEGANARSEFEGTSIGYIPKGEVIQSAVKLSAARYSRELLNYIDHDQDPCSLLSAVSIVK